MGSLLCPRMDAAFANRPLLVDAQVELDTRRRSRRLGPGGCCAGAHSYEICRAVASSAREAGFHGIAYPSYFSLLRTGAMPFETAYGISIRRFPEAGA
jgi:hypothetical protein